MIRLAALGEQLHFIETCLEHSRQIALVSLTADLKIINHNNGFLLLIEQTESLNGEDFYSLLPAESRQLLAEKIHSPSPLFLNFETAANNSVPLRCSFQQTTTGYLMFGELVALADSDVMRTMSVLNNEMVALTRELGRKNRTLQHTQQQLTLRNQEIEEFAGIVAHDFNSPLVTIAAFVAELEQDLADGNQANAAADLEYIKSATQKLTELLAGLQRLTSIGIKSIPPQRIALEKLIGDCLTALAGPLREKNIRINVSHPPLSLLGEPLSLGQIWQNLIENAIKYMGNQSQPQIDIGIDYEGDTPVYFVRDNGIGIKTEHADRIFKLFTQLSNNNPGIGLGLALVKKIVEQYQGTIRVDSQGEGQGSCFRFTLPGAVVTDAPESY